MHENFVFVNMKLQEQQEILKRVKIVREEIAGKGRTKRKFAQEILGIPYTTYLEYEKNIVRLDFLRLLARRFNYRMEWLVSGSGDPRNDR